MGREQSSINASVYYGPRSTDLGLGAALSAQPGIEVLVYDFSYDNLPDVDADDEVVATIPGGSVIVECRMEIITAFSGASIARFDVGLKQPSGTTIDLDGLIADGACTSAGTWVVGSGALIGTTIGSADGQLFMQGETAVPANVTATAGTGRIILSYYLPK